MKGDLGMEIVGVLVVGVLFLLGLQEIFRIIRSRFTGGPPRRASQERGYRVHGADELGQEQFAIGTFISINQLRLFEHGCHIRTERVNVIATWEEIESVRFTYKRNMSINGFTGQKIFELRFNLTTGEIVPMEIKRFSFLWGIEFLYHNRLMDRLLQVLNQHAYVRN